MAPRWVGMIPHRDGGSEQTPDLARLLPRPASVVMVAKCFSGLRAPL
jgi:hypothetical protein